MICKEEKKGLLREAKSFLLEYDDVVKMDFGTHIKVSFLLVKTEFLV